MRLSCTVPPLPAGDLGGARHGRRSRAPKGALHPGHLKAPAPGEYAVRPQPVSIFRVSGNVVADDERDEPDDAEHLKRSIAEERFLRRTTTTVLEDESIAQEGG